MCKGCPPPPPTPPSRLRGNSLYRRWAACSVVVGPSRSWFDPWCGHDKICAAVGPLSRALNPTLFQGVCLLLSEMNCKSLWIKASAKWHVMSKKWWPTFSCVHSSCFLRPGRKTDVFYWTEANSRCCECECQARGAVAVIMALHSWDWGGGSVAAILIMLLRVCKMREGMSVRA